MSVSTIIPTLNEEANIGPLLDSLSAHRAEEVIVVDGGSADRTRGIAGEKGARVFEEKGGLVRQLNQGAKAAKGEILFFLPADSRLLGNPFPPMERLLGDRMNAGGGFTLDYGEEIRWKILSAGANFRGRRLRLPMGDQGIFLRREDFLRLGGFREGPLLPDLDLVKRLSHYGIITVLPERLGTSPRRYEQNGLVRNWALNQALFITHRAFPEKAPAWAIAALQRLRRR